MNPRYVMIAGVTLLVGALVLGAGRKDGIPMRAPAPGDFTATVITTGLSTPWDLLWGPDGMIWVSERGGRISRVDPANGRRTIAGEIGGVNQSGEGGLMGIAWHPDFIREPWLYAMHTYSSQGGTRNRLVRIKWDGTKLGPQEVLFDGIPGAGIHNGSRIVVGRDRMLYITTGDAGDATNAQDSTSLGGKILRLDLNGKIPAGNPFGSAIWSWGHRNGQGLVFYPESDRLYETEHGAGDNDEVNVIIRGGNYGWPNVRGACDDGGERDFCQQHRVIVPQISWTPTVAISGASFYVNDRSRWLNNSLLATSLNGRTLWRMPVDAEGAVTGKEVLISGTYGRLRDVIASPTGDIYICTSNRDGRGSPTDGDDRIIRLTPKR